MGSDNPCNWLVATTQPHREAWAAENVIRQGFEVYLPKFIKRSSIEKRRVGVHKVQFLFPGYLFVCTTGLWRFLLGTFGVNGVVTNGEAPALLPHHVMGQLFSREDEDGFIRLPGEKSAGPSPFSPGQQVRIVKGPFAGRMGMWEGSTKQEREQILLDVLGGKSKILIDREALEAV